MEQVRYSDVEVCLCKCRLGKVKATMWEWMLLVVCFLEMMFLAPEQEVCASSARVHQFIFPPSKYEGFPAD